MIAYLLAVKDLRRLPSCRSGSRINEMTDIDNGRGALAWPLLVALWCAMASPAAPAAPRPDPASIAEDVASATSAATPPQVRLPEASLERILFAQISDSGIRNRAVLVGKRSFIWGAHPDSVKGGVYGAFYYPSMRDFDKTHTVQWYQKNRPDWVVYKADQKTPAYDWTYSWGAYTPLDITRSDVRQYILKTFLIPAMEKGFPAIAYDNVAITNGAHRCGVWREGKWVPQFSGASREPAFATAILDYIGWLRSELHARGTALALNAKLDAKQPELTGKLLSLADIWLDEGGFSQDYRHQIVDDVWRVKFELASRKAAAGAYVSMNTVGDPFATITEAESTWILANFLLVRGARSYLAILGKGDGGRLLGYPGTLNPPMGHPLSAARAEGPVYLRLYEHGLAVVNPSSSNAVPFAPPRGKWLDVAGNEVPASVMMKPRSGLLLISRPKK
jgi:hypothetical protein